MQMTEFEDNDYFSLFESIVIQMNKADVEDSKFTLLINLPKDEYFRNRITEIIEQCDVDFLEGNQSDFTAKDAEEYLSILLQKPFSYYDSESKNKLALSALRAVINNRKLYTESGYHTQFSLQTYKIENYVRLDTAALEALNIFPHAAKVANPLNNTEVSSIFEIFNEAQTSIGKRLVRRWLKQPIRDAAEINRRLDIVGFFVKHSEERGKIQNEHLKHFPDMEKLYAKFYKVRNNLPHKATLVD